MEGGRERGWREGGRGDGGREGEGREGEKSTKYIRTCILYIRIYIHTYM